MASNEEEDAQRAAGGSAVSTENDRDGPCIVRVGGIYSVLYEGQWYDARVTGMDPGSVHVQYLEDDGTKERQIPKEDLNWRFRVRAEVRRSNERSPGKAITSCAARCA